MITNTKSVRLELDSGGGFFESSEDPKTIRLWADRLAHIQVSRSTPATPDTAMPVAPLAAVEVSVPADHRVYFVLGDSEVSGHIWATVI